MEISGKLILHRFERKDPGEHGAVFLRYETPEKDKRKIEMMESPMYYGGQDYLSYVLSVPIPRAKQVTGVVIVERTSKNRYTVSAWANGSIINFSATNTEEIVREIGALQRRENA